MKNTAPGPYRARSWGVRTFRATLLIAVLLVLRFHGSDAGRPNDGTIALDDVRHLFPDARAVRPGDDLTTVLGEEDVTLGFIVKTLPGSRNIIGYAGPSDVLIALDREGTVTGTELLWSGDTDEHTWAVREAPNFFDAFTGWTFSRENDAGAIDAVSGATLTSLAIVQSVAVRLGGHQPSLKFPDPLALDDVQRIFPDAARLGEAEEFFQPVHREDGTLLGNVVRTSPRSDAIMGYQGPSDGLIGFTPDERVAGITLGGSYENQRYADYVREDGYFTTLHEGLTLAELAEVDERRAWVDGVSGATMTSGALMEGVVARAKELVAGPVVAEEQRHVYTFRLRDGVTLLAIVFAAMIAFTRLRARRSARLLLQLYLVAALGLWAGDMVSLAVLGGWAEGTVPLKSAPGLVALVAAAFILPWGTGKPVYCQHICPHGAAQELLYRIVPGRLRLPRRAHRILATIPFIVLAGGLAIVVLGLPVSLSALEPFDAWIFGIGGVVSIAIALVGLVVAAFIPQAYCKYGCPTGLVLDYARTRRHETGLTHRDAWAAGLLLSALLLGVLTGP